MNMPAPQGAPAAAPKEADVGQMVQLVGASLAKLSQSVPPEFQEKAEALLMGFESLIEEMAGGGAPKPAPQGNAPMNAGGNPKAAPVV